MQKVKSRLILQRIQKGKDPDAFAELYDAYIEKMYRFISFKVGNRQVAEDLTSDLFLKLWEYLTTGKSTDIQSLNGLIYRMARNLVIDHYRKNTMTFECPIEDILHLTDSTDIQEQVHLDIEVSNILAQVKHLKQEYQEVVLLRYIEELSIKEIAEVMQKKRGAVRVTLHRATKTLQALLDEQHTS
ncbi:MAG: hypothetical protein UV82_C0001G0027 [Candidatus Magasanikbacteria bacterium GW2011_GWD2_43_18]|uniref:RNA polymerase, sigma-24 subunit, ECF subfamily n=1 Tax=Candidatus Magasanikbacteria bacterium GW2011_GWE2_42_7 TaxID=1619052 RepID=A0A0G1BI44_9BACT|nr:MAG: hypothetical protein UV18_C0001G0054 [Candidatus Magasanikbacteria bacterium GW2011_GWC2_42_27]KKS72879.1 MAG: hypothetical protein UV42_C0003G0008 [Candidatus Magasanikbacteria bacterium GW2011_GWE2_42_7]KKT05238.1 MAG: hypothetical protein UV82_C0001G0027 [Candidatus Magasanikbacteria bacterium GW2011_GWD2_43_18]KKT26140.1 MAG: hypothetical protein UW10_C0001G0054 [Candidatus Magasanikbacteria bacterium GW2011_GWA2_43_9]HBB37575.1 hypothetical protein [Candidatus Magasanikbacteria bac